MALTIPHRSLLSLPAIILIGWILPCAHAQTTDSFEWKTPPLPEKCLVFETPQQLSERKSLWAETLAEAFKHDPDALFAWVVGKEKPHDAILEESKKQMRCLLIALLKQEKAAKRALGFLEISASTTKRAIHKATTRNKISGRLERKIVLSNHRTLSSQAGMWRRRGQFSKSYKRKLPAETRRSCERKQAENKRQCVRRAIQEIRERKLLHGTAAPGLSRHHWGTEFDLFAVNSYTFRDRGPLGLTYAWLQQNAHRYGFFQTYLGKHDPGYIAERWHWSYSPISQPTLNLLVAHEQDYARTLDGVWERLAKRWNRHKRHPLPHFSFVRKIWRNLATQVGPDWPVDKKDTP